MKKEKTILLGGLVLALALGVYMIAWAALDVGNDLDMQPEGHNKHKIINLNVPSGESDAATWGYVKDAVGGLNPGTSGDVGIWRQSGDPYDIYLGSPVGGNVLSGNVGIGTNDPQYSLDLQGTGIQNLRLRSTSTTGFAGAGIYLGDAASSGDGWHISSVGEGGNKPLDFGFCNDLTCATWNIRFTYDGKVGIGTHEPHEKLHVTGDAWVSNDLLVGGFIGITSCNAVGVYPPTRGIRIGDDSYIYDDDCAVDWPPPGEYPEPAEMTLYITSGDSIAVKAGADKDTGDDGNYGIYVNTDGKVGIGTDTTTSDFLTILSKPTTGGAIVNRGLFFFNSTQGNWAQMFLDGSNNFIIQRSNGGLTMDTDGDISTGNIGIGVSPGDYKLNVASGAAGTNQVLIGDDLTVGALTTTNTLNVDDDVTILGSLKVSEIIEIGGTGFETCTSANVGALRYYEGAFSPDSRIQVCMKQNDTIYGWWTIKSYSW